MKRVNLIIVLNKEGSHVLMCHRQKNPYKGLYNFVGGKVEPGEDNIAAAYRELYEETGITREDLEIRPLFYTQYFEDNLELQTYVGQLEKDVILKEEANPLVWIDFDSDFLSPDFAGDGNINHMISCIKFYIHAT
jgi:8-oxo-dGTP diphosphatase